MTEPLDNPSQRELWFTRELGGRVNGPLTTGQLQHLCRKRTCQSTLDVRKVGASRWTLAAEVPELFLPGPLDEPPPSPQEQRAAVGWWEQDLAERTGRTGAVFFGLFLLILLTIAGNTSAALMGARADRNGSFFGLFINICVLSGWIGGLVAVFWLPRNCRHLWRLSPAWRAMGLVGTIGLILLFALVTVSLLGLLSLVRYLI
jgi:hypothetical protein